MTPPIEIGKFLDVEELAFRSAVLTGVVESGSIPRIAAIVAMPPDPIGYRIAFTRDAAGQAMVDGRIEGTLPLICQRCLADFDWPFDARFGFLVIGDECKATNEREAVVYPGGKVALAPMIEDELLLALPHAPVHAPGVCRPPEVVPAVTSAAVERPSSPFSVLRTLRTQQESDRSR